MNLKRLLGPLALGIGLALGIALVAHADTTGEVNDLASEWNLPAPGANANILTAGLQLRAAARNVAVLRIQINLAVASKIKIVETDGTTTFASELLGGTTLNANQPYALAYEARAQTKAGKRLTYNFQVETDGVIQHLRVTECDGSGN